MVNLYNLGLGRIPQDVEPWLIATGGTINPTWEDTSNNSAFSADELNLAQKIKERWGTKEDFVNLLPEYRAFRGTKQVEFEEEEKPWLISELWERVWAVWEVFERQEIAARKTEEWLIWAAERAAIPLRSAVQIVWEWFWAAWDIIWAWVATWFKALWGLLSAVTPDKIEDTVKEAVWETWKAFLESSIWQSAISALQWWVQAYQEFKANNPETAETLEAIWNIASFTPIWAAWWVATKTAWRWLWRTWTALRESAEKSIKRNVDDFAQELVSPIKNKKQIIEDISKGRIKEWWIFAWRTRKATAWDIAIANEVKLVPWFWPGKTLLENNNAILKQIWSLDYDLIKSFKKNDVLIPKKETISTIKKIRDNLADNPLLVWDAEKVATKLVNKFEQIIKKNPWKASWLLKSRREFDTWIKTQKWTKIFDPANENALSIAIREIRTWANNLADAKAVNVWLKETLKKQSRLFRAIDKVAPKAKLEADSAFGRLMQTIKQKTWLSWELAAWIWLISWWALATLAPAIAATWAWVWAWVWVIKWLLNPATRKFLWRALNKVDDIVQKTPNPDIQLLKAEIEELLAD